MHDDNLSTPAHVGHYNVPSSSVVASIITGAEENQVGLRNIVFSRRGSQNSNLNEVFDTDSVSHR